MSFITKSRGKADHPSTAECFQPLQFDKIQGDKPNWLFFPLNRPSSKQCCVPIWQYSHRVCLQYDWLVCTKSVIKIFVHITQYKKPESICLDQRKGSPGSFSLLPKAGAPSIGRQNWEEFQVRLGKHYLIKRN